MKLVLPSLLLVLPLLFITSAQAAPQNKIHLVAKADSIAVKSAQLIELKFKIQTTHEVLKWHLELHEEALRSDFSRLVTNH